MDARRAVLSVAAIIGKYDRRKNRRKDNHFDQDNPDAHIQTSV